MVGLKDLNLEIEGDEIIVFLTAGAYDYQPLGYFTSSQEMLDWFKTGWDFDLEEELKTDDFDFYDWCKDSEIKLYKTKKMTK